MAIHKFCSLALLTLPICCGFFSFSQLHSIHMSFIFSNNFISSQNCTVLWFTEHDVSLSLHSVYDCILLSCCYYLIYDGCKQTAKNNRWDYHHETTTRVAPTEWRHSNISQHVVLRITAAVHSLLASYQKRKFRVVFTFIGALVLGIAVTIILNLTTARQVARQWSLAVWSIFLSENLVVVCDCWLLWPSEPSWNRGPTTKLKNVIKAREGWILFVSIRDREVRKLRYKILLLVIKADATRHNLVNISGNINPGRWGWVQLSHHSAYIHQIPKKIGMFLFKPSRRCYGRHHVIRSNASILCF